MNKKIIFANAPVIEVVIGVQFDGSVISNKSVFDFYQEIKDRFPDIQEHPILPSVIERIDERSDTRILAGNNSRHFFISSSGNRLFQIQPDKILFNWRKTSKKEDYPHFTNVLTEFYSIYNLLDTRCGLNDKVNQLEVTYVDHIILNDFNLTFYNLTEIFKNFSVPESLKSIDCNMSIPQPNINGNLILKLVSAIRNSDKQRLISCETTCRGMTSEKQSNEYWYNQAHQIISNFFINFISDKAKKVWGYES